MKTFYSQQGEDAFIYKNFINKFNSSGVFVELGGMNGVVYSNTKFFEDYLAFSGTLIEPTEQYNQLIVNRPKCKNYKVAVNYSEGPVKILGDYATAGLVETMSDHHKNHWLDNFPAKIQPTSNHRKYFLLALIEPTNIAK
jgi:hypothetical protein